MSKDQKKPSSALVLTSAVITNKSQLARFQKNTAKDLGLIARTEKENVARRIAIGIALHVIKNSFGHGNGWTPWTEKNVLTAVSRSQMHLIMAAGAVFIEQCRIKPPDLAALTDGKFTLAVKEGPMKKLSSAAVAFVGDLTWGELLAKYDIKDGPPALGGARAKKKGVEKAMSAEQLYQIARDEICLTLDSMKRVFLKENKLQHMLDAEHREEVIGAWAEFDAVHTQVKAALEPLLKK